MHYDRAREIMGPNFFGPAEWERLFSVRLSDSELRRISEFPWSEEDLLVKAPGPYGGNMSGPGGSTITVRDRHFAFLGLQVINGRELNLAHWVDLLSRREDLDRMVYLEKTDREESFAQRSCLFRWYLMPWDPVYLNLASASEDPEDVLPDNYELPYAIEQTTHTLLFNLLPGRRVLNERVTVVCKDAGRAGFAIGVGPWDLSGPTVKEITSQRTICTGSGAKRILPE